MATMQGGCLCGEIRYRVDGDFGVTHCHCIHCRKLGGAAFVTWVEAGLSDFDWTAGKPAEFTPRPGVTRSFCPNCGSPLTYYNQASPESIDLTAGSLDDPSALQPDDHVWFDRKVSWLEFEDGLKRYGLSRKEG